MPHPLSSPPVLLGVGDDVARHIAHRMFDGLPDVDVLMHRIAAARLGHLGNAVAQQRMASRFERALATVLVDCYCAASKRAPTLAMQYIAGAYHGLAFGERHRSIGIERATILGMRPLQAEALRQRTRGFTSLAWNNELTATVAVSEGIIDLHCVQRVVQRLTGTADVDAVRAILLAFVRRVLPLRRPPPGLDDDRAPRAATTRMSLASGVEERGRIVETIGDRAVLVPVAVRGTIGALVLDAAPAGPGLAKPNLPVLRAVTALAPHMIRSDERRALEAALASGVTGDALVRLLPLRSGRAS